jgi:hypothetical protein
VVRGHVEACPLPSSVRSLTPVSGFYVHGSKGGTSLHGIHALTQGRSRTLRVGQNGAPLLGVGRGVARSQRVGQSVARSLGAGRAEPMPQGSGAPEPTPYGSGEFAVTSFDRPFNFDRCGP